MRKAAIEQVRLEARAQAFTDALSAAKFAEQTGRTAVEGLEELVPVADQAVAEHIKVEGRWCP